MSASPSSAPSSTDLLQYAVAQVACVATRKVKLFKATKQALDEHGTRHLVVRNSLEQLQRELGDIPSLAALQDVSERLRKVVEEGKPKLDQLDSQLRSQQEVVRSCLVSLLQTVKLIEGVSSVRPQANDPLLCQVGVAMSAEARVTDIRKVPDLHTCGEPLAPVYTEAPMLDIAFQSPLPPPVSVDTNT